MARDLNHEPNAMKATEALRSWIKDNPVFTNLQMRRGLPTIDYTSLERARANLTDEGILTSKRDGRIKVYKAVVR